MLGRPEAHVRIATGAADARRQLGVVANQAGEASLGRKQTEEAISLYQALVHERPDDHEVRLKFALTTVNLGNFAREHDPKAAIARYRDALDLAVLRKDAPSIRALRRMVKPNQEQLGVDSAGPGDQGGGGHAA